MYRVVKRGEWAGGVLYDDLLDKPQRWFTFDRDRRVCLKTSRARQPGELLDQGKFTVFSWGTNSDPWGKPMADLCYFPYVLKHHLMKNQGLWLEKWASPTPAAKYKTIQGGGTINDENKKKALEVAMAFQSDWAIALPDGIDISLIESVRSGQVSYEAAYQQYTEIESRVLTGQVLANFAVQPGSFAQARVHAKQVDNKIEMLAIAAAAVVSQDWIVDWVDRNFGEQDLYPTYEIPAKSEAERTIAATNDRLLMANGFRLSRKFGEKRYQVVPPEDEEDVLTPVAGIELATAPPVSATSPAPDEASS
jgi:phage gp29-like protein